MTATRKNHLSLLKDSFLDSLRTLEKNKDQLNPEQKKQIDNLVKASTLLKANLTYYAAYVKAEPRRFQEATAIATRIRK